MKLVSTSGVYQIAYPQSWYSRSVKCGVLFENRIASHDTGEVGTTANQAIVGTSGVDGHASYHRKSVRLRLSGLRGKCIRFNWVSYKLSSMHRIGVLALFR